MIRREPVGVIGQVTPWNYPMMMAVWKWAPAIAAGNSVVLKPSDTTPASTVFMAEIMGEFLPDGVINVICGERETGKAVVEHTTPAMVSILLKCVTWRLLGRNGKHILHQRTSKLLQNHCQVLCMQLHMQWLILGCVLCRKNAHPQANCACRGNVDFEDATRL